MTRRERRELERRDRPIRDRSRASIRRPARRPAWQSPFALVSAAALVVAVAIIVLNQRPSSSGSNNNLIAPPITYSADIVEGERLGRADAPVVLEIYSDFQCPVCGRLVREQLASIKSQLVDPGLLQVQSRDIAIVGRGQPNESIELAAGAACAAKQDRYWQFHDVVFWNQGGENVGDYSSVFIAAAADRAGVDRTAWDQCFADDAVRSDVRARTQAAATKGINSTPTLVLNGGQPVPGIPNLDALVAAVQSLAGVNPSPAPTLAP